MGCAGEAVSPACIRTEIIRNSTPIGVFFRLGVTSGTNDTCGIARILENEMPVEKILGFFLLVLISECPVEGDIATS